MKMTISARLAGALILIAPSAAAAQDVPVADAFVAASVGYHDLGLSSEAEDDFGLDIDDSGLIYGIVAGFDLPIATSAFVGLEGNYHAGSDVIDGDYGVTARLGYRAANGSKFYLRGGYQWVNIDPTKFVDEDLGIPDSAFAGIDDTEGDYLVGVGADVPFGGLYIRGTVDTIAFDTFRATVGVGFAF